MPTGASCVLRWIFSLSGISFSKRNSNRNGRKKTTGKKSSHWTKQLRIITNQLTLHYMDFVRDMFSFLKERRKWWLTPIILLLIFLGVLIVIGGSSAVAPFIYTLF